MGAEPMPWLPGMSRKRKNASPIFRTQTERTFLKGFVRLSEKVEGTSSEFLAAFTGFEG
jgi:hypothetical protein